MSKKLTVSQMRSLHSIVDNPALPAVLGRMQPRTLVRLIDRVGLNDAAELMALVPAPRLLKALDEAVWRSPRPGANPVFDPAEFINWLQVWNEIGEPFVAEQFAAFNDEYLAMCLSSVLLVDGDSSKGLGTKCECFAIYGHFLLRPAFDDDWEIVRAALDALWRHEPDRLLHVLGTLASSESMLNSDGRRTSLNLDVAFARERHLERGGYVSPAGARAFLAFASVTTTRDLLTMSVYDNETRRFLDGVKGIALTPPSQDQITALSRLLESEAIVEPRRFESLQWNKHATRRVVLAEMLNDLEGENQEAFQQRTRELAYLATVLMAGSSLEGQPFTGGDARDSALATCNLGVEFIHSRQGVLKLDREPGLIRLFLIGWQLLDALRDRVIEAMKVSLADLETTQRLKISPWLRDEAKIGIRDLQNAVERHQFVDVRDAATFLSIVFDATACREIAPLLDHLPHFVSMSEKSRNNSQPRWIESIADLDRVGLLLSNFF